MNGISKIEALHNGSTIVRRVIKKHTSLILPSFLSSFLSRMSSNENTSPPALGPAPASDEHDHSRCGESCSLRNAPYTRILPAPASNELTADRLLVYRQRPNTRNLPISNETHTVHRAMAVLGNALVAPIGSVERRKLLQNALSALSVLDSDMAQVYTRVCINTLANEYGI